MKRFANRPDCAAVSAVALMIVGAEGCAQAPGMAPQSTLHELQIQPGAALSGAARHRSAAAGGQQPLQIELKHRREADFMDRFERRETSAGMAVAPGAVIFLRSRKLKDDTQWDAPARATEGRTYSIGLSTHW